MKRSDILDAWVFLRKKNQSIPDDALDFIKNASLKVYDGMMEDGCKLCANDGNQSIFPSECTGCCASSEYGNFKLATRKP